MNRHYSTLDISAICEVDPVTVGRWCDNGTLHCYRTPGGHRRVLAASLLEFLQKYGMEVPAELAALRPRVLAVTADARLLASLKRRLRAGEQRVEFLTAKGGIEGLLKVGVLKPSVVLYDLNVPEIDGMEACRQLRTLAQTEGMQLIELEGGRSEKAEEVLDALAAGHAGIDNGIRSARAKS